VDRIGRGYLAPQFCYLTLQLKRGLLPTLLLLLLMLLLFLNGWYLAVVYMYRF
ncbi:hypothetical protein TGAM01_v200238, partial [Trichoderma gamsii]